jgi:hypothetical protein
MAEELIQGLVMIDPERGTADARDLVAFYPSPPDYRPCVKSGKELCFENVLNENELLDTFGYADMWLKYTLLSRLSGRAFIRVIGTSTHDLPFQS